MAQNNQPPIPERTNTPPPLPESNSSDEKKEVYLGQAAYNIISDTVIGVNTRKSDNKFQAIFILCSILISAIIGAVLVLLVPSWTVSWLTGAIAGAAFGLIAGFFASGIYLMIYRAMRHMKGKHD